MRLFKTIKNKEYREVKRKEKQIAYEEETT
jgi:hypothetical protein